MRRLLLVLATLLAPTLAQAQVYQSIGWWQVIQNEDDAGCLALAEYQNGAIVAIGLETATGTLGIDLGILSPKWSSIVEGRDYEVTVTFDRHAPWYFTMEGAQADNLYGLEIVLPAESDSAGRFVDEFMGSNSMEWVYAGTSLGDFSLTNSRRAFNAVVECTELYAGTGEAGDDPFATPPADPFAAPKSDPFR